MTLRHDFLQQDRGKVAWSCYLLILIAIFAIVTTPALLLAVDSERFEEAYSNVEEWLLKADGEIADVSNFEYKKDAATFHFDEGRILLRREIEGRPTVGIFIGKGRVDIAVPLHVERQNTAMMTGDSVISKQIDICYIRFADDFDLELKKALTFRSGSLSPSEFRRVKSAQGDYFFKPVPGHRIDNYFQLVRSAFNRVSDGLFWSSFGRYVFSFDPTRPEEVSVLYNREPTSLGAFRAASFQRQERLVPDSAEFVDIVYPMRGLGQETSLEFEGANGWNIASGQSTLTIFRERDSAQFASVYLDRRLTIDSAFCNDQKVSFHRRKSFDHVGLNLPSWYYHGDTVRLTLMYHGDRYGFPFLYLGNPAGYSHTLKVTAPESYKYPLLGEGRVDESDPERRLFEIKTGPTHNVPEFIAQATGWDTYSKETSWGLPLHYTWPKSHKENPFRDKNKMKGIEDAFDYFYQMLGPPPGVNELFLSPHWVYYGRLFDYSNTGFAYVSFKASRVDMGGFAIEAGIGAAEQWLSSCTDLRSYRESWILNALPTYLMMMYVQSTRGDDPFHRHLLEYRKTIDHMIKLEHDYPLACGPPSRTPKGVWSIHMIRNLLNAVDASPNTKFLAWMKDVVHRINSGPFSNTDLQHITEQYFGFDLSWFFELWIYGTGLPQFEVDYSTHQEDDSYYVDMRVITKGTSEDFLMPILIRIDLPGGPALNNCFVAAKYQDYRLGPYADEPISLHFNRYLSVLSIDNVERSD